MRCPPGQAAALRRKRGVPCKSPPQFFAYHAIRRVPWISLNIGISLGSVIAISRTSFRRIAMGNSSISVTAFEKAPGPPITQTPGERGATPCDTKLLNHSSLV